MKDRCPGCGAAYQHDDPLGPGYLPPDLDAADPRTVCRRCYRLRHYGRAEGRPLAGTEAERQIARAVASAGLAAVLLDLGDFEGSLPPRHLLPADKPLLLVINKMDLLPPKAKPDEVERWARERWRAADLGPQPRAVVGVSAVRGGGLAALRGVLGRHCGPDRTAAFVGATSVGKSTLLRQFLARAGTAALPTASCFPGTTQAATRWRLGDLTIYDTPGFVPGDRMLDRLCPDCAARLVPERGLAGRLYRLTPGQAVVFGGLSAFILRGAEPRVLLCYAAEPVPLHRTGAEKAYALLSERPGWLMPRDCARCRPDRPPRRETRALEAGEDLAVAGLGWISLRGGPGSIEAAVPEGVRVVRRPALFGPRTRGEETADGG